MQIRRRLRLPAIPSACTLRAGPARALALLGALAVAACGGGGNDESGARSGVTVAQPLTASPLAVAPAEKVTLQAQCTGNGAITYRWDAGDGRALEDSHVASHAFSYPAEGDYRPKVTCVDERGGLSVSATDAPLRVAVPSHTLVSIQAQAGASTANTTHVDFNAECQGPPGVPLFISWDFGDGATGVPPALPASTASVSHTYDNTRSTQYTATAHCQAMSRIKTPRGESLDAPQTVTGSTTVSVAPAGPRPTITSPLRVEPIIPTTAAPATFTLTCDPGNGGTVRYTFDFGDGTPVERNNTTGRAVHAYVSDGRKAATQHLARATCTTSNPLTGERSQEQTLRLNVRSPVLSLFAGAADRPRAIQRMARAADGTIYVSQTADHRILKALPGGSIVPFAGTGQPGRADGVEPGFNQPTGLALGPGGVLYVADTGNHAIRAVSPQGKVSTVAGGRGAGSANGADASFSAPTGIAVDSRGIVYVADTQNHLIRRIAADGTVSNLAGTGSADWVDGPALSASFNRPVGLAVDLDGSVYVSEEGNHTLRRIAPDGQVSTLAGTGSPCETDPVFLKRRLTLVQTGQACLNRPVGLALDRRDGTLVFADSDSTGSARCSSPAGP